MSEVYRIRTGAYLSIKYELESLFKDKVDFGYQLGNGVYECEKWIIDHLNKQDQIKSKGDLSNTVDKIAKKVTGISLDELSFLGDELTLSPSFAKCYSIELTNIYNEILNQRARKIGLSNENESYFIPKRLYGIDKANGKRLTNHITNTWYFDFSNLKQDQIDELTVGLTRLSIQDQDPNNEEIEYYLIYKFLLESEKQAHLDWTISPSGINYIISVSPKAVKLETIELGYLTNVVWKVEDEEILKVDIEYFQESTGKSMPTAEFSIHRETRRQWKKNTGYQEDEMDKKVTDKKYVGYIAKNKERYIRMTTIKNSAIEEYITLIVIMITQGDVIQAENLGKEFFNEVSIELNQYLDIASDLILQKLQSLIDENKHYMGVLVPPHPYILAKVPNAIGHTIGSWLQKKLSGLVV